MRERKQTSVEKVQFFLNYLCCIILVGSKHLVTSIVLYYLIDLHGL